MVTFVTETRMCTTCITQTGKITWYFSHSTNLFHFYYPGIMCVNKRWWKISLKRDEGFFRITNISCPSEASVISPVSWAGSFNFLSVCNWLEQLSRYCHHYWTWSSPKGEKILVAFFWEMQSGDEYSFLIFIIKRGVPTTWLHFVLRNVCQSPSHFYHGRSCTISGKGINIIRAKGWEKKIEQKKQWKTFVINSGQP